MCKYIKIYSKAKVKDVYTYVIVLHILIVHADSHTPCHATSTHSVIK